VRSRLLLLVFLCAASALAFVHRREEPRRWKPGVRLVEKLGEAVVVPPAPQRTVLAHYDEIPFPRGTRFLAVPFRPEPLRGFVARVRLKTREGAPPGVDFKALTAAQAARLGPKPFGVDAWREGRSIGGCFFNEVSDDGWTVCQTYQGLNAGESAAVMVIAAQPGGTVRNFEAYDAEQIPPWAPDHPQLAPLLRDAGNETPSGDSYRASLRAPAGGRYAFDVVLPPGGEFLLATGIEHGERSAPVRFVVRLDGAVLLDEVVRTPDWHEHAFKLPDAANRRARLTLESQAVPGERGEVRGLWGNPRVLARSEAPSILLLSLDAVRPDHLSAYGYSRDTSPSLERVAQTGVRFQRAIAQGANTWMSVLSFLSGRQPLRAGVRRIGQRLPNSVPLLPDMLARRGYDTFVGSDLGAMQPGTLVRFDDEELCVGNSPSRRDEMIAILRQMKRVAAKMAERPTFAWFHLENAHYPLEPLEPLRYDAGYQGRLRDRFTQDDHWAFHAPALLHPREMAHVGALYDSAIHDVDSLVRDMLLLLDQAGATERTIVIVTADHGELLGDHGFTLEHSQLWDRVLHVPLFFLWPGHFPPGHVVDQRVQLVDLVPTVLSLAGLDPEPDVDGRDLSPLLRGGTLPDAPTYSELNAGVWAQYRGDEKLIFDSRPKDITWRSHPMFYGAESLFDVAHDPDELADLSLREPARAAEAKDALLGAIRVLSRKADGLHGAAAGQAAFEMMKQAGYVHSPAAPVALHEEEH
jgi:arylsulfatase A-like enzyme